MKFDVYMIITKKINRYITYVGYTNNIKKRLLLHNSSRGAKFTKGFKWKVIFKETFKSKSEALKAEYKLKKNYKIRYRLKNKFIKNENFSITSL